MLRRNPVVAPDWYNGGQRGFMTHFHIYGEMYITIQYTI